MGPPSDDPRSSDFPQNADSSAVQLEPEASQCKADVEKTKDGKEGVEEVPTPVAEGYIRLVSGDGFSFTVRSDYAMVSTVVSAMMASPFKESRTRIITLPEVRGCVLEKVCQYFYYIPQFRSQQSSGARDKLPIDDIDADALSDVFDTFVHTFHVPLEICVELLLCAKFLDL